MIQQLIYRRAEQGYRTVAQSGGLMGKGLAKRIEALSILPPSGGKKRLGAQPVYARCAVEDGIAILMTAIDPAGMRGSHLTHAWYVEPEDADAFSEGGGLRPDSFLREYHEQSRMDELPAMAIADLPGQDILTLGCEAARALFGGSEGLLAQFLTAVARCAAPTSNRGFLGVCVLSAMDEEALTVHAYHLMEAALRSWPMDQLRAVGYRTLWAKAEDNVRYPAFFTTPDLIGSEASVPMNYLLFDLRSGSVRLPRGLTLAAEDHAANLARALLNGNGGDILSLRRAEEERIARAKAEEEARRRAEEEARLRREAEARAKREAEERARKEAAEQARLRREAEIKARLEREEQLRRQAEEEARQKREVELRARQAEEERRRRESEERALKAAEQIRLRREAEARQAEENRQAEATKLRREKDTRQTEENRQAEAAKSRMAEEERLRQAAQRQRDAAQAIREQQAAAPAHPAESKTAVLNRFLKALGLREQDVPAHELDILVRDHMIETARANGNTNWSFLNYAAVLLQAIAETMRDQRGQLKPIVHVVLARCAYSIADCVMEMVFLYPTDRRTLACAAALNTVDRQVERPDHPAHSRVSAVRRDKWYIYLNVLDNAREQKQIRSCLGVLRALQQNNVNGALEQLQQTLEQRACDMIACSAQKPARSSDRSGLLARAALATFYAQVKFTADGRIDIHRQSMLSRRMTRALQDMAMQEPFLRDLSLLSRELTR